MGQVVDITLALFARRIAPFAQAPLTVQLVPELEPEAMAFCVDAPDRLLAGRVAFGVLRGKGFEQSTRPARQRVALPPARPERHEIARLPREELWTLPPAPSAWPTRVL